MDQRIPVWKIRFWFCNSNGWNSYPIIILKIWLEMRLKNISTTFGWKIVYYEILVYWSNSQESWKAKSNSWSPLSRVKWTGSFETADLNKNTEKLLARKIWRTRIFSYPMILPLSSLSYLKGMRNDERILLRLKYWRVRSLWSSPGQKLSPWNHARLWRTEQSDYSWYTFL